MVTLEQVKLLETKVAKAIEYVKRQSDENALLREKLDGYRNRIDELEVLVQRFKEDQGRIEAGIVSALNRLNQFEDAIETELSAAAAETVVETAAPVPPAAAVPEAAETVSELVAEAADVEPEAGGISQSDEEILAALEAEEAAAKAAYATAGQDLRTAPPAVSGTELDIF